MAAMRRSRTVTVNSARRSHAAQGAETSHVGWRVAGVGDVQVVGDSHQERRWGEVANRERDTTMNV